MTDLGPTPAPSLQPLRPADRDSRERQRRNAPPKVASTGSVRRGPEPDSLAELEKGETAHQLDERA